MKIENVSESCLTINGVTSGHFFLAPGDSKVIDNCSLLPNYQYFLAVLDKMVKVDVNFVAPQEQADVEPDRSAEPDKSAEPVKEPSKVAPAKTINKKTRKRVLTPRKPKTR